MRTFPLVGAIALAVVVMPGGAKASSFLTVAKPVSILSSPIRIEPARTGTIPVMPLGSGKAASTVLTILDGKSPTNIGNPILQIVDRILGKTPVVSPAKPGTGSSIPTPSPSKPETGIPAASTKPGHSGAGKDCDPKSGKVSTGHGSHNGGHAPGEKGGKDCDPNHGKGGHTGSSGNSGGGTSNGGSSETPPTGGSDGNGGTGGGATSGGGDSGGDTGVLPGGDDSGSGGLPGTGGTDAGDTGTGSTDIPGLGDSGSNPGSHGGSNGTGTGTIPAGGIGDGTPPGGGDGAHVGTGDAQTAAVPEPASWLTMIAGFGFVGAAMRVVRKRGLELA